MEHARRHLVAAIIVSGVLACASIAAAEPLTLPDAIERALRAAPAISIAAANSDISTAHVKEQRAPLFPNVASGGEYYQAPGYDEVVTNRGLSTALVTLDYTVFDWGRRQ